MQIFFILAIPIFLAAGAFLIGKQKIFCTLNAIGYLAVLVASVMLLRKMVLSESANSYFSFIYFDALSAFFIFVISVIAFAAALYSISYIKKDIDSGVISERKAKIYYILFNLFCFSMLLVPAVNNLGMLWVAIEMTTLISAFLVGFYNNKESIEAAWKYIIICSVGIIFALLGTILFSYAFSLLGDVKSLNWSDMVANAGRMDKNILKIAFIFILVGYGTKAGLAPMHTWLPDAHSQAVAPISALLSGVLLKTAIYAILRFGIITIKGVGFAYFGNLMVLLGIISLAISCGFILVQKDLKRLLAYHSIEHIGIISIGFGIGGILGVGGALLHVFNHAVTKALMFFGAGNVVNKYRTHNMHVIRGVIGTMPFTGFMLLMGAFALAGMPPFSIFISEILIICAVFLKGYYLVTFLLLGFIAIIFGAVVHHFSKILFGSIPKGMSVVKEPLSGKMAFLFLFVQICALGIVLPFIKKDLIWMVQKLFQG
ncbi:MAG: hydrogenase [Candidatus Omnitrophica bacterium CG07_land_8_20_14_0_80_42_15]|uniref:Hydrogenase n=1 Tax=Candidatus Aquitaenariimonas noxiae TaxID=1974741 RepID=A0A2J0L541_9BACT|nr:MAG: hydrogenase [Candidatus Omnitrophica bacterium CG07_land_8_20_14_0_80_42_15]